MVYIECFKLPSQDEINKYTALNLSVYPWTIFFKNCFEWVTCKDITIFYGNNWSGKSTVLNLLVEKIGAQRKTELCKDIFYDRFGGPIHPFDDFVSVIKVRKVVDDNNFEIILLEQRKLITSDDIFKSIDERAKHNRKAIIDIENARERHGDLKYSKIENYTSNDYDLLVKILEARKLSKKEICRSLCAI